MLKKNIINILISFDDADWNYTRHAAVTILSLLETNKNNKIKIYIITSSLPKANIDELKRIVNAYNQKIVFIINNNIIPKELKSIIINKNNLGRWAWYRLFFPKFITNIDRILYIDCDILITWDINNIYNMNMKWKAIAWYLDCFPFRAKNKIFWIKHYINSWVLLFDVKKYDMSKINTWKMEEINTKYSKFFHWSDQDKINIIFKDDITIGEKEMNYQITNKWFNEGLKSAKIIHCLQKPYIQYWNIPQELAKMYYKYLNMTKWKWYPEKKANYSYTRHLFNNLREFCIQFLINIWLGEAIWNIFIFKWKYFN